ncbi:MAG: hypothetical protein M3550_02680 [Actinomycetota bacterium]|nr:hypothetical protein [Actinomycetota bacterium]
MLDAAAPPKSDRELPTHTVNVMGHLVEVPACCANPALCEREGCWTPLALSLDGFSGVR